MCQLPERNVPAAHDALGSTGTRVYQLDFAVAIPLSLLALLFGPAKAFFSKNWE
jgi:hypothetical protein